MSRGDERTTSLWIAEAAPPPIDALTEHASADVCIVGAGLSGLTAAYLLATEGRSVLVLDREGLASGETPRTTAHLTAVLDTRFFELERHHAPDVVQLAAESHRRAIDRIERIVEEEKIDCGFLRVDGFLVGTGPGGAEEIERELDAARRNGFAAEVVEAAPFPAFGEGAWLRFPRQAEFHPMRYLAGLAAAARRAGARFARAQVASVEGGEPVTLETDMGLRVTCRAAIVASGTPFTARVRVHTRQHPYRTYAVAFDVPPDAIPRCLVWDTEDPYHYVRLADHAAGPRAAPATPALVVGGEDHRTGKDDDPEERFSRLEAWTRRRFPVGRTIARWSGQVWEPVDGLAHIGHDRSAGENVYLATGFAGNGMTYGTIAGMLLADLACGRPNSWERVYDPARQLAPSLAEWLRENAHALPAYKEWLKGGDTNSEDHVPAGASALMRRGLKMVAVHRDAKGVVHKVSAVCPHLGGIVHWNETEETWDCPAHGSRFDADGHVLTGPANRDLGAPEE